MNAPSIFDSVRLRSGLAPFALLLLLLAAANAPAQIFTSGFDGEVWTVSNDVFPQRAIRFDTPKDLGHPVAGEHLYDFAADPAPPEFESVSRIIVHRLTTSYLGSRPDAMEFYGLGPLTSAVPPPPDWKRVSGQVPQWTQARVVEDVSQLPFLNHAVFAWTDGHREAEGHAAVYLFRQAWPIDQPGSIARATLRIATNAVIDEAALNENAIHLEAAKIGEYDVTRLLRPGKNILAIKIHENPENLEAKYGLAFHLELVRRDPGFAAPPDDAAAALVTSDDGDRLWGRVSELRGDGALFETPYGLYKSEWTATTGILFPSGWHVIEPKKNVLDSMFAKAQATPATPVVGLPLGGEAQSPQDCILLAGDRQTTAKPSYVDGNNLLFEGVEGKRYSVGLNEVQGIYPPRALTLTFKRPDVQAAQLYARIDTTLGESVHGLLRQANSRHAIIESNSGQILTVPLERVADLYFPYHRGTAGAATAFTQQSRIAILPQVSGQEAYQATYRSDVRDVQSAIFSIGAAAADVPQDDLPSPGALTPVRYPVLVSVDPVGEYVHTMLTPGDAQDALVQYLTRGGVLVALSRGGAFRTAVDNDRGIFVRTIAKPSLPELLGLQIGRPIDKAQPGVTPFDHPPNTSQDIFFQRASALPEGLDGLPRRIDLSPMASAPFYPMIPTEGQGRVLYTLSDASGFVYGPALTIIPKGRGWVVIIDHLLWSSHPDEESFAEQVLPLILRWALVNAGQ